MITNKNIPSNINQWDIERDPYGFMSKENWLEGAQQTEDILQLRHIYADGPILDVGYYNGVYRVLIVKEGSWENPIESIESESPKEVMKSVYQFIDKYANG